MVQKKSLSVFEKASMVLSFYLDTQRMGDCPYVGVCRRGIPSTGNGSGYTYFHRSHVKKKATPGGQCPDTRRGVKRGDRRLALIANVGICFQEETSVTNARYDS
ncbi:MAG: hypothetical protein A2V62_04110 [Nitrospirae bacterium RBG_19FT_COMBO_58_9]|nr:MAG: hypothetical protein A2V62_04110 [Nitrospirae bacterium RBG_19FT_COMBO_58_9]